MFYYTLNKFFPLRFDMCFQSLCQLFLFFKFSQFFFLSCNQQTAPLPPSSTFLCFVSPCLQLFFHWLAWSMKQTWKSCFCFFTDGKQTQSVRTWHDIEIMHRSHTWHDYPWPWVSLTWLLYNLQLDDVPGADFENSLYTFGQSEKR